MGEKGACFLFKTMAHRDVVFLVAVDPSAKSLTFGGFSGKPLDFNQQVKV